MLLTVTKRTDDISSLRCQQQDGTTNNIETYLTNQVNNQSLIPSTDVIQLTLTPKMTTTQVSETSVAVNNNSSIQDLTRAITLKRLMRWLLSSSHTFTKLDLLTPQIFVCFPSWFIPTWYYCCTFCAGKRSQSRQFSYPYNTLIPDPLSKKLSHFGP